MSLASEIERLTADRDSIRTKLVNLGLSSNTDKLDALTNAISGITNRGAVSPTALNPGGSYTVPAGYHNGSGKVTARSLVTQEKTITPTKSAQTVTPDNGKDGLSKVTVNAIPAAYQDVTSVTAVDTDVLKDKKFVNSSGTVVTGSMVNNAAVTGSVGVGGSYTVPAGYHNGSGKVSGPTAVAKTITLTAAQTGNSTHTYNAAISTVTVNASNVYSKGMADGQAAVVSAVAVYTNTSSLYGKTLTVNNSSGTQVASATLNSSTGKALVTLPAAGTYTFTVTY